jgi:hypothetical protein
MSAVRPTSIASVLRSLFAAGGASLVLALAVFAVSPGWHHALHGDNAPSSSEGCAVDLFAHGLSLPLGAVVASPATISPRTVEVSACAEIFLAAPRYLRQPERGPPALG